MRDEIKALRERISHDNEELAKLSKKLKALATESKPSPKPRDFRKLPKRV
jgi:hypothetical protein